MKLKAALSKTQIVRRFSAQASNCAITSPYMNPLSNLGEDSQTAADYGFRSVGYAATSIGAIFAGYLMKSSHLSLQDICLLVGYVGLTFPFFIAYASRFYFDSPNPQALQRARRHQRASLILFSIIGLILSLLGLSFYRILASALPPVWLLISLLTTASLFWSYGAFLFFSYNPLERPGIRYQLMWPALLSIGLNLYLGVSWDSLSTSGRSLLPIGILIFYFLLVEVPHLEKNLFILTGFVILALTLVGAYLWAPMRESTFYSVFCIGVAAYLAVFESWSIIAGSIRSGKDFSYHGYYKATFAALIVSGALTPLFYLMTGFGPFFLWTFGIHAIIAFTIWYRTTIEDFRSRHWVLWKTLMGYGLLLVAIVDTRIGLKWSPVKAFVNTNTCWFLGIFTMPFLVAGFQDALRDYRRGRLNGAFDKKVRFLGVVPIVSLILLFITFQVHDGDQSLEAPASHVFLVYSMFIVGALLALLYNVTRPANGETIQALLGLVLTTRLFTALVVGLSVWVGAYFARKSVFASSVASLPFLLATMGGFALNDYYDVEKDRINKPHRAIPSGRLERNTVGYLGCALLALAAVSAAIASTRAVEVICYCAAISGVLFYNIVVKYCGLLKTIYTALLTSVPFWFIVLVLYSDRELYWFPCAIVLFIAGRELLMDIVDLKGDSAAGSQTVPMLMGSGVTAAAAFVSQASGTVLLVPISSRSTEMLVLNVVALLLLAGLAILWRRGSARYQRLIVYLMWLPMLAGLGMFIYGQPGAWRYPH